MNRLQLAREALVDELADLCMKALKDAGFVPRDSMEEKLREVIEGEIQLGQDVRAR